MKKEAVLINISRGKVVDEHALINALKEGWISSAGLDVFDTEPLSKDSALGHAKRDNYSPHCRIDAALLQTSLRRVLGEYETIH